MSRWLHIICPRIEVFMELRLVTKGPRNTLFLRENLIPKFRTGLYGKTGVCDYVLIAPTPPVHSFYNQHHGTGHSNQR